MVYSIMIDRNLSYMIGNTMIQSSEARSRRRRLLILAENQILANQIISPAFRSRGWEIDRTEKVSDALELIEDRSYDLIILEILHPGSDGYATCEALRKLSHAPLLLIVSSAASVDIVQGLRRGADAYVIEPFDMRELLVRAEALVRRSEGRIQASS
jgi:DNA-binding response OmpR family regulator